MCIRDSIIAMKTQDQRKTHLTFYLIKEVVEACEVRQDALMISLAFEAGLRLMSLFMFSGKIFEEPHSMLLVRDRSIE